ncbi:putative quinol monooxygenase [Actinomadura sp. 3N508]|uniref:putative quinol monooxygenase n=1 Tax=Actinomadura sp. 3N508 TaxID=3375153 RepID=UPI0037B19587
MIIISGWLSVDPAGRDAYLAGCRRVVEAARATPGCLDFALAADLVEPDRITVYERWETDEAVERFRGGGPEPEQAAQIRAADVKRYRISAVEPP